MRIPMDIGKYKVIGVVGQGGMGKVYKAVDPDTKKFVIIKELTMISRMIEQRFKREADIMKKFQHVNIVSVYDFFRLGKHHYISMEFMDGLSLEQLIEKRKRIEPTPAMLIFMEACKGLDYAHKRGVIHRDIKPDNVLLSKRGEVKLVDFGIATALPDSEEELTKTGAVMGTPAYMSPEQLTDAKHVDKRSDIYSMGIVLYQMVTGRKPYANVLNAATINKITSGIYDAPAKINLALPDVLANLIKKAMHHNKGRRFKDMEQMLGFLDKYRQSYRKEAAVSRDLAAYIAGKGIEDLFLAELKVPTQIKIGLRTYRLKKALTIGRDRANDIVITDDSAVSRRHARIEKKGRDYYISDSGSANGTFVDRFKIPQKKAVILKPGLDVKVGNTQIILL